VQTIAQSTVLVRGRRNLDKLLFLIPAFLIILTIVLVSVFLVDNRNSKVVVPAPSPRPLPLQEDKEPAPQAAPQAAEEITAAGWKTYVGRQAQYVLRFPPDWILTQEPNGRRVTVAGGGETITIDYFPDGGAVFGCAGAKRTPVRLEGFPGERVVCSGEMAVVINAETAEQYLIKGTTTQEVFDVLLSNFKFSGKNPSASWKEYRNSELGLSFKYPPQWELTEETGKLSLTGEGASLVVETQLKPEIAELSASEIMAAIRNLSGWKEEPELELRNIGGGSAQILRGEFEDGYQEVVILWSEDGFVQAAWNDSRERQITSAFDEVLASLSFVR